MDSMTIYFIYSPYWPYKYRRVSQLKSFKETHNHSDLNFRRRINSSLAVSIRTNDNPNTGWMVQMTYS